MSAALFWAGRAALNWACSQQEPVKHMCERKKKKEHVHARLLSQRLPLLVRRAPSVLS